MDSSEQVGLNISLRYIFKPSYSPHCINSNVVCNGAWTEYVDRINNDNQTMGNYKSEISGHLDIFVADNEDEFEGEKMKWKEVLIHGDPEGLKSFARLLMKLADTNQDKIVALPIGAREHMHLRPKFDLSNSSQEVIVGRLDAKGTGDFYNRYVEKNNAKD